MNRAAELLDALGLAEVSNLSVDSRRMKPGGVFLAYPGDVDDGRLYVQEAIDAGAAGVFWEAEDFDWQPEWRIPNVAVQNLRAQCGYLADAVYGEPSRRLPVVAVTGTSGKTTVSHLTAQLLAGARRSCGLVGTLGAGMPGELTPVNNTTPEAPLLQAWLRRFIKLRANSAVIEASSHGIAQGRLDGMRLAAAVCTNVTRDHLDYHATQEDYWRAKERLFEHPGLGVAVLNADDPFCHQLAKKLDMKMMTYGRAGESIRLAVATREGAGWRLSIEGMLGRRDVHLPLMGRHNVYNFLAAALAATALNVSAKNIIAAIPDLTLPAGRMQRINRAPAVYVDYAHSPDAITAAVVTARATVAKGGRLIVLLGAGGGRDKAKRAEMGRAAAAADVVIVTDDNPRNEDPEQIRDEICKGAPDAKNIGGRREAIHEAMNMAKRKDVVLLLGKGHETTQHIGNEQQPFSDEEVFNEWRETR